MTSHDEAIRVANLSAAAILALPYATKQIAGIDLDITAASPYSVSMETRGDTEDTCHCGADYAMSDHCPVCGCEQYESGDCGHRVVAVCPYGQDGERVCCGRPSACTGPRMGRSFLLDMESV